MKQTGDRANYGIDAPGVIRDLFLAGLLCLALSPFLPPLQLGNVRILTSPAFLNTGVCCVLLAILMLLYSKIWKFRHRDRMLSMIPLSGREQVLDVGTGAGLLLVGCAKRLTSGKATGLDLWSSKDLSNNQRSQTLRNVDLEGVSDKVELLDGDATAMKLPSDSFDVVVSNMCIHNIPSQAGRDQACREIARVLRPGGLAVISDYIKTREYEQVFAESGLTILPETGYFWTAFPPLRIIKARKS